MRIVNLIICLLLFNLPLLSEPVSIERATTIAENWFRHVLPESREYTGIDSVYVEIYDNDTTFYVFGFNGGGFVIVPADDKVYPVLGFSTETYFVRFSGDLCIDDWYDRYSETVLCKVRYTDTSYVSNEWYKIENNDYDPVVCVGPLLNTSWATWHPYFVLGPDISPCSPGGLGCVPLAVAQIIKYWEYPEHGFGCHHYACNYDLFCNGDTVHLDTTFSADFTLATFNYSIMPFAFNPIDSNGYVGDLYEGIDTFQTEQLIYHTCIASSFEWGQGISFNEGMNAMRNHFGYDNNTLFLEVNDSSSIDTKNWFKAKLVDEISNGRPVLFGYPIGDGGHALVLDGFYGNKHFHFRMGRGTVDDGYYYLFPEDSIGDDIMCPGDTSFYAFLHIQPCGMDYNSYIIEDTITWDTCIDIRTDNIVI